MKKLLHYIDDLQLKEKCMEGHFLNCGVLHSNEMCTEVS